MPRSRSRSIESSSCSRIWRGSTVWVISRMRSASVDFPWSMWAMIEKLRMWAWSAIYAATTIEGRSARRPGPRGHLRRERDAVAPSALHRVERAVGAREQRGVGLAIARDGDPDRGGDAELRGGDRVAQARGRVERLGVGLDGQQ